MSVRINLLPREAADRQRATRQRHVLLGAGALLVLALGGVTLWQDGRIDDAGLRLADEQAVLALLQGEIGQLAEFDELGTRVAQLETQIVEALADEVSIAGILQDVAAVMPDDAEFESLTITATPADPEAGADIDEPVTSFGTLVAVGRSASDHAPGVERLLVEFDKVAAFHEVFLASSVLDDREEPYPRFIVETQLGPEILTGRYADGLPEGLR